MFGFLTLMVEIMNGTLEFIQKDKKKKLFERFYELWKMLDRTRKRTLEKPTRYFMTFSLSREIITLISIL